MTDHDPPSEELGATDRGKVRFELNGSPVVVDPPIGQPLLQALRDDLGIRSARGTCGVGVCGTCTVLVDGRAASSCLLMAHQVADRSVVTSEGLVGPDGQLDEVQDAFLANQAYQCSFCIPAMVLTVRAHLDEHPDATTDEIREVLGGNLCRCGTYPEILVAVEDLVARRADNGMPGAPAGDDRANVDGGGTDREEPR